MRSRLNNNKEETEIRIAYPQSVEREDLSAFDGMYNGQIPLDTDDNKDED